MIARLSLDTPQASADSWPARRPPSVAYTNACKALEAQARKTASSTIKDRAREYLAVPWQLDMIRGGFVASLMSPDQLIAFAKEVLRQDMTTRYRYELIPVQKINAKAAILVGRYSRAKAHQIAGRAG